MTTTPTTNLNAATPNPDEAIQKTLAEDAKRRDEQRKAEAAKYEFKFQPDCLAVVEGTLSFSFSKEYPSIYPSPSPYPPYPPLYLSLEKKRKDR